MSQAKHLARVIPLGERTSHFEIPREYRQSAAEPAGRPADADGAAAADAALLPQVLEQLHDGVCLLDLQDRIRFWNSGAERISGFKKDEVVGRNCHERVFSHSNPNGELCPGEECPNRRVITTGQGTETEFFIHHREGYRLPISLRVAPLRGRAGGIIGSIHIFAERPHGLAALDHARDYERFTFLDSLTEAGNRKYTEVALGQALEAFIRFGRRPGVAMIDVDRLTHVNHKFGRAVGDQLLKAVTKTVISCMRPYDFLGRWKDDQFYAILADTQADHLSGFANQLCVQVAGSTLDAGPEPVRVTISVGTSLLVTNDTLTTWLGRAERNLREAKNTGGNRVITDPVHTLFNWLRRPTDERTMSEEAMGEETLAP